MGRDEFGHREERGKDPGQDMSQSLHISRTNLGGKEVKRKEVKGSKEGHVDNKTRHRWSPSLDGCNGTQGAASRADEHGVR